jgi:predicted oxidoreductase
LSTNNLKTLRRSSSKNGPELSLFAAGMWRLHEWNMNKNELSGFIEDCLELGITTFDHADIYGDYGNEEIFGRILKSNPSIREKMEIVTKCGICLSSPNRLVYRIQHYNTTAEHIRASAERSLKMLATDYIDLLLIHRPDPLMDASEMADAFMALIDEGKVKHVGVSNFTPSQFNLLQSKMDMPLATNQVECSLLHTAPLFDGTFDQAQELEFSPMIWSPMGGGDLFNGESEQAKRIRWVLGELSEKYGAGYDQLSLAWLLQLPCKPLPVLGTGKIDRVRNAVASAGIELERQDWFSLLKASRGHDVA